jgi:hypothetical protein
MASPSYGKILLSVMTSPSRSTNAFNRVAQSDGDLQTPADRNC